MQDHSRNGVLPAPIAGEIRPANAPADAPALRQVAAAQLTSHPAALGAFLQYLDQQNGAHGGAPSGGGGGGAPNLDLFVPGPSSTQAQAAPFPRPPAFNASPAAIRQALSTYQAHQAPPLEILKAVTGGHTADCARQVRPLKRCDLVEARAAWPAGRALTATLARVYCRADFAAESVPGARRADRAWRP